MENRTPILQRTSILLLPFIILSVMSCQDKSSDALIPNFEIAPNKAKSENHLSDLIESYRIIKLETSDECILGPIKKIYKSTSYFFVKTAEDDLVLFDKEGNYIRMIGAKGRGPGEYLRIQDFAVNDDESIVTICSLKDLCFYRVGDGSFIKKVDFDYFINSIVYLPNDELLVQTTQTDFLIARIDTSGKTVDSFGTMSMALEFEQAFEFVKLDNSNFLYRIGQTTDVYAYNLQNSSSERKQIFEHVDALREQELHDNLVAQGDDPLAYSNLSDFFKSHYRIMLLKKLNSNLLLYYLYQGNSYLMLYNTDKKIKKEIIFAPKKSSNIIDDILYLPTSVLSFIHVAGTYDNSIITYIDANSFLKNFDTSTLEKLRESESYEIILELTNKATKEDNPIIIEFLLKEI
jgi:hypothetical protein